MTRIIFFIFFCIFLGVFFFTYTFYSDIAISPAPYKPGTWQVFLIPNYRSNAKERVQLLDVNAKERLELYLISNPNVTCNNINVITVRQKD